VADEESIVGTENAGIISLDVVAAEQEDDRRGRPATGGTANGKHSAEEPRRTEKDTE
jgi:branched-chain amino acid transport system ATP-binding protein